MIVFSLSALLKNKAEKGEIISATQSRNMKSLSMFI